MLPLRMLVLLMLMFLVCDADSMCPAELNPLILDPPEIIEEYGNSVSVNCNSTAEEHEGMHWRVGNQNFDTEENDNFISHNVSLSDWNMTAECRIKLNDSYECSEDLQITVYRNPEVVTSIKHVKETQYELQCDIINVAPVQYLTVTWYKNNQFNRGYSFTDTTKIPVNKTFILMDNISRGEKEAQFRCEAQLDFRRGPRLPVVSETQNVSVHYAPELNTKDDTGDIYEFEGNNITLNCEAEGNPPPVFHWTCDGVNMSENTDSLSITPVNTNAKCTCTATNYLGNITKEIHVHVKMRTPAAPETTPTPESAADCSPTLTPSEIVVRFGDPASVDCSTSDPDVSGMGWEATVGGTGFEAPPNVTWMVEKLEDWNIESFCYISRHDGHQCIASLSVTVYKTPDTVSVYALDHGPMVEGTEYHLKCDINNVAPVQTLKVKWYRGNETVLTEIFSDTSVTPVNVSSTLKVTPERDYNGSLFRCEAELHLGPNGPELLPTAASAPYAAIVHYKPLVKACPGHYSVAEHEFSMDMLPCQTDGNPPPTVQWYYQDELINSSKTLTRNDSGMYMAEVVNSLGRSVTSVLIAVQYGPFFACNERYEVELKDNIQTQCEPEGLPTPSLTWFKDGKEMVSWTKHDSGQYLLKANNTHGTAEHTLYLDILYAPELKEGDSNKEVILGKNVTLECNAEGNPAPEIYWKFTSAVNLETTEWRQKIVNVTGATSTSAGVYSCVATNKLGSVTRSVTLVIKGEASEIPYAVISGLLILLAIFILLMLIAFFRNRQKKHGQYSFVPDSASTAIPMTTTSAGANS